MGNNEFNYNKVDGIENHYGGLYIMNHNDNYYWMIENYDTNFNELSNWKQIDKKLYDILYLLIK